MSRFIKVYWPFSKAQIQEFIAYRTNFYMYILGELLITVVVLYIWNAVFNSADVAVINGFTFDEMISYVILSTITGMLIENDVHWSIGSDVRSGDIAMNLIKPVSYQLRQYASAIGFMIVSFIFISFPLWIGYSGYMYISQGVLPNPVTVLLYLLSCMMSSIILFCINYAFGLAAFYVSYIFGFIYAKEAIFRFFSGALIPLAFFPLVIRQAFDFMPFSSLIYTPVMIHLGKYTGNTLVKYLLLQLFWVVFLFALDQWLWKRAIKRLTILGG